MINLETSDGTDAAVGVVVNKSVRRKTDAGDQG
jgi:hypothetical protein